MRRTEGEEEVVRSAVMEPSTLQWPGDRQTGGQTGKGDRMSARSDISLREAVSWTESERELMAEGERREGAGEEEGVGLMTQLEEEEEPVENHLPEKAAQVFSPAVTVLHSPSSPRESEAFWEMESEKSPFLGPRGVPQDYNHHGYPYEWTEDTPPATCKYTCPSLLTICVLCFVGRTLTCLSLSLRWVGLSQQGHPEGGRFTDDISTLLPLPGVGGVCLPAV